MKVIEWGFYLLLALPLFLFGGGFVGGYTLLEGLTLAVGVLLLLYYAFFQSSIQGDSFPFSFLLLFLWAIYLFFQLIPLPVQWVQILSPHRLTLLQSFAPAEVADAKVIPLSLASYGMRVQVGKCIAYTAIFFIAYHLILDKVRLRRFCFSIVLLGTCLSIVGLLFYQLSPHKVYGLFSFDMANPRTPYLNKNQFANYLVMTLSVTLAYIFLSIDHSSFPKRHALREKVLWLGSTEASRFIVITALFLVQLTAFFHAASRGGLLALLIAVASFVVLIILRRRGWKLALVAAGCLTIALYFGLDQAKPLLAKLGSLREFSLKDIIFQLGLSKELKFMEELGAADLALQFRLANWKDTLKMFSNFPLFGIGAGGFHELFSLYKTTPEWSGFIQRTFYAENELLQALAELGLVGTGLLTAFGFMLAFQWRRRESAVQGKTVQWLSWGLIAAIVGMLVQGLVDFPMHLPANMALFAACGGVLARITYLETLPELASGKVRARGQSIINTLFRAPLAMGAVFLIVPLLWHQWFTEYHYLKGEEVLLQRMKEDQVVSPAIVRSGYTHFFKALEHGQNQARLHESLGRTYTYFAALARDEVAKRKMWYNKAEESMKQAIALSPYNAAFHHTLGQLYVLEERDDEAAACLRHATLLAPQNPSYHISFGENQLRLGRKSDALESFKKAVVIDVDYLKSILITLKASGAKMAAEELAILVPINHNQDRAEQLINQYYG